MITPMNTSKNILPSLLCVFFITIFTISCSDNSYDTQVITQSSKSNFLQGGFQPNETIVSYTSISSVQRTGIIAETGDTYNYSINKRIELIPQQPALYENLEVMLKPQRVTIISSCKIDKITDKLNCSMNMRPYDKGFGGIFLGLSAGGNITSACVFGHDFPGRKASIRVDKYDAMVTNNEGCLWDKKAQILEQQLIKGKMLITRRVEWPYDYSKDKTMLISGSFSNAQKLFRWVNSADLSTLFAQ